MSLSRPVPWPILVLAVLFPVSRFHDRFVDSTLRVTFFDVGQGDAILAELPRGKTLLVDAGGGFGDYDMGKAELLLELARRGILSLDAVLLTHPDQDHGYGFLGVLQNFAVGALWLNG